MIKSIITICLAIVSLTFVTYSAANAGPLREQYKLQQQQPTAIKGCTVGNADWCQRILSELYLNKRIANSDVIEIEYDGCDGTYAKLKSGQVVESNAGGCLIGD